MNKKLYTIILSVSMVALIGLCFIFVDHSNATVKENLMARRFIAVRPLYPAKNSWVVDLKSKELFSDNLGLATKDNQKYIGDQNAIESNGNYYYEQVKEKLLLYQLIATDTTEKEIRDSDYELTSSVSTKNRKILKRLVGGLSLDRVKIIYSKDYLPIELKFYDRHSKEWVTEIKYNYPYKSSTKFEKDLEKCIAKIKNGNYLPEE